MIAFDPEAHVSSGDMVGPKEAERGIDVANSLDSDRNGHLRPILFQNKKHYAALPVRFEPTRRKE